jgi:hypothetical protein
VDCQQRYVSKPPTCLHQAVGSGELTGISQKPSREEDRDEEALSIDCEVKNEEDEENSRHRV